MALVTGLGRAGTLPRVFALVLAGGCARTGVELYPLDGEGNENDRNGGVGGVGAGAGSDSIVGGTGVGGTGVSGTGGARGGEGGTISAPSTGGAMPRGGTGGVSTGARPSGGSAGQVEHAPYCPSVVAPNYEKVVFATVLGDEVWVYRSNGGGIRVNAVGGPGTEIWKNGDFLVVANTGQGSLNISLVNREGNVLWKHSGRSEPVERNAFFVNEGGDTAVRTSFDPREPGYAVLSDGTESELPGPPVAAPDASGWVPFGVERSWGFSNVRTGATRRAPLAPAPGAAPPFAWNGRLVYVALDTTGPVISVLTPDVEARIPIAAELAGGELVKTDVGGLLIVDSVPRAVVDIQQATVRTMNPLTHEGYEKSIWTHGSWGLLVEGTAPLYSIELSTGVLHQLPLVGGLENGSLTPVMNDGYAIGLEPNGVPAFWVERERGTVATSDGWSRTGPAAELRAFGSECIPLPANLLDDGSMALRLRDDWYGGIYPVRPGSPDWTPIGSLLTNVETAGLTVFPDAWVVAGYRSGTTGCPSEPWTLRTRPGVLVGDSVQIVLAHSDVIYENTRVDEFVFQETGRCGLVRGMVDDFPTGVRTELPARATQVTFW